MTENSINESLAASSGDATRIAPKLGGLNSSTPTFYPGWYVGWKKLHFFDTWFTTICGLSLRALPVLMIGSKLKPQCKNCRRARLKELGITEEDVAESIQAIRENEAYR